MNLSKPAIVAAVLCTLFTTSCTDEKKQLKDTVTKKCIESGDKQFPEPKLRAIFHEYCECSGEKTSEKLSKAEWASIEKMKDDGRQAEIQAKLMPILQPCIEELQQKMAAQSK